MAGWCLRQTRWPPIDSCRNPLPPVVTGSFQRADKPERFSPADEDKAKDG
jgi:hypothetical protein